MTEASSASDAKRFIDAAELHRLSEDLGEKIALSEFKPTFIIVLWRGGCYTGMVVQEMLELVQNAKIDHVAVRTSSRDPVTGKPLPAIQIHACDYACSQLTPDDKLLIVDDVWDSGRSGEALLKYIAEKTGPRMPKDTRVAVVFYKPLRNKTSIVPDYYVEETSAWLVFPHELAELSDAEIQEHRPRAWNIAQKVTQVWERKLKQVAGVFD